MNRFSITILVLMLMLSAKAQEDTLRSEQLQEVTVSARRQGTLRLGGAQNGVRIGQEELFRAACCNLGESFTTNPSIDVSYDDATTGARQIKLLGLSGIYVQMLTENLPNFRGAAAPYALGYVPGPWMKSIQVSKGASSVRNGYESITGQIDVEYLKPEDDEGVSVNLYGNSKSRVEANADANVHLTSRLNAELLAHYEKDWGHHDDNDDGFLDQPRVRQWNLQSRWDYLGQTYIFHGGIALLKEEREGGQLHSSLTPHPSSRFITNVVTDRYEAYMKHAFVLNRDHGTNLALMASGTLHQTGASFGYKGYDATERNAYAQLMFEHHFNDRHELSAGLSLNHDYNNEKSEMKDVKYVPAITPPYEAAAANSSFSTYHSLLPRETTPGIYTQYTYTFDSRFVAMLGLRADHSSRYGTFYTPRLHLKYSPTDLLTLRLSVGKGYRSVHALAENSFLLASGRTLRIDDLSQETAWNYGVSTAWSIPIGRQTLKLNAEYYYTRFGQQAVVDYDSDPLLIWIHDLHGRSFSHTLQVDATYPLFEGMTLMAAWRLNDVKTTYGGCLLEKPLTSHYKGLVSASYKTPLGLWQMDVTLQLNGGGRMPTPYTQLWEERFPAYEQLQAQVTRWFRHFSVYVGGENLTGFRQKHPIIGADHPWGTDFDPTLVWGPVHGPLFYVGLRLNFGNKL